MGIKLVLLLAATMSVSGGAGENSQPLHAPRIIFDTDIGNDVDDVLALGMLHNLQTRGACELLGVTISKSDDLAGPFANAVNTFYGRPDLPIGCVQGPRDKQPSR